MRIAVISDITYRACVPWDKNCLSYYGSEPYHAVLAWALQEHLGQNVHFFAPAGSSRIGTFHPLIYDFGSVRYRDSVDRISVNPYSLEQLMDDVDFIIDMSAHANTVENLYYYHGYDKYLVYRNGWNSHGVPRIDVDRRNFVVPSKANQALFADDGYKAAVAYYGIPDFYSPDYDERYFLDFHEKYGLETRDYFLFPHRPTPDKGVDIMLSLAKRFPKEKFVIATVASIYEHQSHLHRVGREAKAMGLTNFKIVDMPQNPKHHFFKRELMRRAKAVISPLGPGYKEGFGLANAEAVACGTPLLVSDSPSTRELWVNEKDGLIVEGVSGFENAVRTFDHYTFSPENKFTTQKYADRYMELIKSVLDGTFLRDQCHAHGLVAASPGE